MFINNTLIRVIESRNEGKNVDTFLKPKEYFLKERITIAVTILIPTFKQKMVNLFQGETNRLNTVKNKMEQGKTIEIRSANLQKRFWIFIKRKD